MRRIMLGAAGLLALLALPAAAQGMIAAAENRNVVVEVREEGRLVATSSVRLQLGRPAAIAMNGPFAMRLRIDAQDAGYTVRPHLTASGPGGWTALRSPSLTVAQGQQGRVTVERPGGPPLEIAVSVD